MTIDLKLKLIECLPNSNLEKSKLIEEIYALKTLKDCKNYMLKNKSKLIEPTQNLDIKKDKVILKYPKIIPLTEKIPKIDVNFFQNNKFNSNSLFYYQYRNYKIATIKLNKILLKSIKTKKSKKDYGLYFPILMNFRQSIELSLKLIYINSNNKNLNTKILRNHCLLDLFNSLDVESSLLKSKITKEYIDMIRDICFKIDKLENDDASFSRYLIGDKYNFSELNKITLDFETLTFFINQFYPTMDKILKNITLNFKDKDIFTE
jgi:hypothetical protein